MLKFLFFLMSQPQQYVLNDLLLDFAKKEQYSAMVAAVRLEMILKNDLKLEERQRLMLVEVAALSELQQREEAQKIFTEIKNMSSRTPRIDRAMALLEFDLSLSNEGTSSEKK